ncbi:DUF2161 family putative PD-(D/E)XK-type phosphodiesterase [Seohaeicola saemankumensis]|nr:DUF2161 family putative PD-(D/E)XK-type phosphodiesterase [Seohaeicola saemankumensis]MCA0871582.1 DUF2161 family putative PD-(D/E)XK-type phosphodiesterase [Seohaeicola saemankumensis]
MQLENDLYPPVKTLLEAQGYDVKGEVGAADVVAVRGEEDPVIVELKLRFTLSLFHQAITRQTVTDLVYIAVPKPTGRTARRALKDNRNMCRRLGLGLITVMSDGRTEVHCDPGPYAPRKSKQRKAVLLREFARREGDPNRGGSRGGVVTAYRQDAIRCAEYLSAQGASKGAVVAKEAGVARATRIMADNHYGWFMRVSTGIYDLAEPGRLAIGHT